MFKHQGKTRTAQHNLQVASVLPFVAGIVNVAGFLAVQKLTTNVTGHFAFFVDAVFQHQFLTGFVYFLYVFFFFFGAFVSSLLVELVARKNESTTYIIPIIIEIILLLFISLFGKNLIENYANVIAYTLLFSMGLQNALVTKISNSVVRTTHLTGLFTDLGIELAQLFFYKQREVRYKLFSSVRLRLTIISFFFIGGMVGGLFYDALQLSVLLIAVAVLIFGLVSDYLKLKIILINRKLF